MDQDTQYNCKQARATRNPESSRTKNTVANYS